MGFSPCYVVEKIVEYPCEKDVVHSLSPHWFSIKIKDLAKIEVEGHRS
jgi:hypothetical protein